MWRKEINNDTKLIGCKQNELLNSIHHIKIFLPTSFLKEVG